MSRMLDALKALESRRPRGPETQRERRGKPAADPARRQSEAEPAVPPQPPAATDRRALEPREKTSILLPHQPEMPTAPFQKCCLPAATEVADYYLDLAKRINEQLAGNYSNALLFVSPDHWSDKLFSMTHLAQAFALHSVGDVLVVDGDLRHGRLSKSICPPGPGMTEVMLGTSDWEDVIHPTNSARIDFAAAGNSQVPTLDRPAFGWAALRPKYRAVLIGLSPAAEPEIVWLAARCDAVYFVICRPRTRRHAASTAINSLRAAGANVLGSVVVND